MLVIRWILKVLDDPKYLTIEVIQDFYICFVLTVVIVVQIWGKYILLFGTWTHIVIHYHKGVFGVSLSEYFSP